MAINETEARLNSHEAVCTLRYESLCARLKRIEQVLLISAGFMISVLVTIAFKMN